MMLRPEMRFIYNPIKDQQISAGFGYDYETLNRSDFTTKAYYRSQFAYLQLESKPIGGIDILAGLRYDHHNIYGHQWSPKLGLHYKLNNHLSLLSSIGYGFKAPDFRQLYLDFTNAGVGYTVLGSYVAATQLAIMQKNRQIQQLASGINGDYALKPEHSINVNIGAQWNPASNIHIEANVFYNHLKDMIDTRTIAYKTNGQSVYSYYNIDKVHTQGIEANATWNITSCLQVTAGYQLLYAINDSAANAFKHGQVYAREGNTIIKLKKSDYFGLAERSRHTANIKVYYTIPKWHTDLNIRAIYRSKYGMYDTNGDGYIDDKDTFVPGYTIVYVAVNKEIDKHIIVSAGADNLFNYTSKKSISDMPGRIGYGKLTINF